MQGAGPSSVRRRGSRATLSREVEQAPVTEVVREVIVSTRDAALPGILMVPAAPDGIVVFAHGSGSSRLSPRNRMVAATLVKAGFATLLFDLLDEREAMDRAAVFDVEFLAARLGDATAWILAEQAAPPAVGYVGASTGAGAALWAAADLGTTVGAVVSRGGRPDLAGSRLAEVLAPTLLVVGGRDEVVLELNRGAQRRMRCPTMLEVVPGATHLFEEPGTLERVAALSAGWFRSKLAAGQER